MPGMVELGEDIFLKPVRKGMPTYRGALHDMVANPRSATVMGLLEEARLARARGTRRGAAGRLGEDDVRPRQGLDRGQFLMKGIDVTTGDDGPVPAGFLPHARDPPPTG